MNKLITTPADSDVAESPVNIIHDLLNQAHATLDLIYTLTTGPGCEQEHIETLCKGTLSAALHGAMLRITEAIETAERWTSRKNDAHDTAVTILEAHGYKRRGKSFVAPPESGEPPWLR